MQSGVWFILVVPAVFAFIFSVWVIINMVMDVSEREQLQLKYTVRHTVRMKILPAKG